MFFFHGGLPGWSQTGKPAATAAPGFQSGDLNMKARSRAVGIVCFQSGNWFHASQ
jgi:hypothetical protein